MNVYKITDYKTPYSGGMVLVAAKNEQSAKKLAYRHSFECLIDSIKCLKADLIQNLIYNIEEECVIEDKIYYE